MGGPDDAGNPKDRPFRIAHDGPAPPLFARHLPVDEDLFYLLVGLETERADPVPRPQRLDGKGGRNRVDVEGSPTLSLRQAAHPSRGDLPLLFPLERPEETGWNIIVIRPASIPPVHPWPLHPHYGIRRAGLFPDFSAWRFSAWSLPRFPLPPLCGPPGSRSQFLLFPGKGQDRFPVSASQHRSSPDAQACG